MHETSARTLEEIHELVNRNAPLAYYFAGRIVKGGLLSGPDGDELRSAALVGLWDACRIHDPAKGRLATVVRQCVRRRLLACLRALKRRQGKQLPASSLDSWAYLPPCRRTKTPPSVLIDAEQRGLLPVLVSRLPQRERSVIERLLSGMWSSRIAEQDGVSRQRVDQIKAAAAARMRLLAGA